MRSHPKPLHLGPAALLEVQRVVKRIASGGPIREVESGLSQPVLMVAGKLRWFRSYPTPIGKVLGLDLEAAKHLRQGNWYYLGDRHQQVCNMAALQCVFAQTPPAQILYRKRNVALYRCDAGELHHVRAIANLTSGLPQRAAMSHHKPARTAIVNFSPRGYRIEWSG